MLQDLSIDVWLCYGSFFYGFEGVVHAWDSNSLWLKLQTNDQQEAQQVDAFFQDLIEKPKGLVRVDVRVYGPESRFRALTLPNPVRLFSDEIPRPSPAFDEGLLLCLSSLKGFSEENGSLCEVLQRQIRTPRPSARPRSKRYDEEQRNF